MPWGLVRGHDRVLATIRKATEEQRLPHAFLFVGPDGIGKRTFALRLAQALLCESSGQPILEPCGHCPGCLQAAAGAHPDLITVGRPPDKQDLPIAVIRQLCHDLGLKPARGGRKVAIVDDGDDLNDEAANAFLKTLEEPPDGSLLIVIASAAEVMLETVVSRCRVVRFEPLAEDDLRQTLIDRKIVETAAEAENLAKLGEGSVSRAQGLADPSLIAFRRSLIDALARPEAFDAPQWARQIEAFVKEAGKESVHQRARASLLAVELGGFFRGVLWRTAGLNPPSPDPADRLAGRDLAQRLEPEDLFVLADRCLETDYQVQRNAGMGLLLDAWMLDLGRILQNRR